MLSNNTWITGSGKQDKIEMSDTGQTSDCHIRCAGNKRYDFHLSLAKEQLYGTYELYAFSGSAIREN